MRINIDATPLLLRSAGVKNYLWHWIHAMRRVAGDPVIRAFPFLGKLGALDHDRSTRSPMATLPRLAALHAVNYTGGMLLDACLENADVFHASNQMHYAPRKTLLTATIHDMTCWKLPELHTAANVAADKRFAERILKRAAGIIAVSEATREDAIELLDLPEERVEVIYSGVADEFYSVPVEDVLEIKERAGIARPYVLFVGTIEPRKNIGRLLDAWANLAADIREEHQLVIAGPAGWDRETLRRLEAGVPGVKYVGYVAQEALPALTAGALAFAYPSLYEGFGFPVAQAMACGVPVLTSNISSLPEIAEDAAEQVDALSLSEITAGLERLLTSQSLRQRLGLRGKERAQMFRWSRCAARSLTFFERIAGD